MGGIIHARLKPSAAYEWGRPDGCPGSVAMQERYPETAESETARDGNAAHWVGAELLGIYANGITTITAAQFVGRVAPNGVTVTDEMAEAVQVYVDDVVAICADRGFLPTARIEKRVEVKRVHATLCWGTYDTGAIIYDEVTRLLYIWDFKYGFIQVEAFENWQALCYAIGLLDEITGGEGLADQNTFIEIRIIQPRGFHVAGPVRPWRFCGSDLRGYANILFGNAALAISENPPTRAGEQCRFCTARHACETLQRAGLMAQEIAGSAIAQEIPDDALGLEHSFLKRAYKALEYRLTGIEAQIIERIETGTRIPGKDIVQGKGRQKFNDDDSLVKAFASIAGIDILKPRQLITPKQCISAGMPKELIDANSFTPATGIKLVDDNKTLAARVFGRQQS